MSTSGQSKLSVRETLRDRCLTVASHDDAVAIMRCLDAKSGGIVFSSTRGIVKGHTVRQVFPGLVIASDHRERGKAEQPATPQEPITLPVLADGVLAALSPADALEQLIEGQMRSGAHVGVIPGRAICAEDSDSIKALFERSNALDRDDVIVRMPVSQAWLRRQNIKQFNGLLALSKHPIALSPADKRDPMENKGVPEGLRQVIDAHGDKIIIWKTDLAGIDAITRGALAAAVGVVAGLRHSSPPGGFGKKIDEQDRTPQLFLPELLRYVRASHMHDVWFANTKPWICNCTACLGRPVDRFTGSSEDLREAAVHNALAITGLHQRIISAPAGARSAVWHEVLENALAAHAELSLYTEHKVDFPGPLRYWLDNS